MRGLRVHLQRLQRAAATPKASRALLSQPVAVKLLHRGGGLRGAAAMVAVV